MGPFYEIVEYSHMVFGLVTNSLLMIAIFRFTRQSLGHYKHLQFIFAAYNCFLIALHAALKPERIRPLPSRLRTIFQRVMVVERTIFGVGVEQDSRYLTAFCATCNTVPFYLMIIDFLYRYWSIRRPHLILFSDRKFIAFLIFIALVEFSVWFLVCSEVLTGQGAEIGKTLLQKESRSRLNNEITDGWLIMNYWEHGVLNGRIFGALIVFDAIMIGSFSIAIALGAMTYYHIYVLRSHSISTNALAMQRKLFIAVCAQTGLPLVFVYLPYICVLNLPFFSLPVFFWDDACMLLASCFPAWDAFIVIALMPDYWKGLIGMIWRNRAHREIASGPIVQTVTSR